MAAAPAAASSSTIAPPRPRNPFHALSHRNFRLFFFGQMISVAGTWMQTVAQQWLIFDLTHSSAWLGIVSGASAIPYVALTLYGGQVADRLPRRTILIRTQAAAMVLAAILTALAFNPHVLKPWHIVVLAALLGVVNAFNMPAQQAFVTDMVDDRASLGNAIALNSLQFNLARVVGPVIAGAVLVKTGAAGCFAINALSYIAVIASLTMMRLSPKAEAGPGGSSSAQAGDGTLGGLRYIVQTPSVLRIVLMIGIGSLFAWSVSTLYPVFATRFHAGAGGFTAMMAANGVGAAIGGFLIATFGDRLPSRRPLVYGGAIAFSIGLLLFAHAPTYPLMLASLVLCGFAMMQLGINANTTVQNEVPDALRGRVMAIYTLVFGGLFPLGGLEIGFISDQFGPVPAVTLNAVLCLIAAIGLFTWSQRDLSRRHRAPID